RAVRRREASRQINPRITVQAVILVNTSQRDSKSGAEPSNGMSIPWVCGQRASMAGPKSGVNMAMDNNTPPGGINRLPKNAKMTRNPDDALTAVSERNSRAKARPSREDAIATTRDSAAEA